MLLNGGEYNGVRLLARNTVRLMTMNQIGDLSLNIGDNRDNKFGFGFSIVSDSGSRLTPSQAGTYSWGGVFSTAYWVDPKENMLVLLYEQMWGRTLLKCKEYSRLWFTRQSMIDDNAEVDKDAHFDHLCSLRYFSRSADFRNLPTEVLGMASMTLYPSGIQNFANLAERNSLSSPGTTVLPSLITI